LRIDQFAVTAGHVFEFVGVAVLVLGSALATGTFLQRLSRRASFDDAYHGLRADLGPSFSDSNFSSLPTSSARLP
jgi:hypothetical protein